MTVGNLYYTMVLKSDSVNPLILFSPPKSTGSFIFFIYFHVNVRIGFSISIKSQQGLWLGLLRIYRLVGKNWHIKTPAISLPITSTSGVEGLLVT